MASAHGDLDGVHVLVVEDTDDSREMLRLVLEYCGALVTAAESAEKARRIPETLRPHVLVTDIAMPDDGIELIRQVKTVAQTKGIDIRPSRSRPTGASARSCWPRASRN
jgi:CheY-like chemotaxis protein